MENTQLAALAATLAPDAQIVQGNQFVEITISPAELYAVAEKLKNNSATTIDMLVSVTGMDYGTDLGTVYHLRSTVHNHMIVLKTRVSDRENPEIDSLCALWPAAEFHERGL
ncbi:MAG: NADH-quinone oxidoreductase subunit C [Bacteroidales bacterium]